MIHARLDRKTLHGVFCGGRQGTCVHKFGRLHDPIPGALVGWKLDLDDRGEVVSVVEKCPLCGEPNVIDVYELIRKLDQTRTQ